MEVAAYGPALNCRFSQIRPIHDHFKHKTVSGLHFNRRLTVQEQLTCVRAGSSIAVCAEEDALLL